MTGNILGLFLGHLNEKICENPCGQTRVRVEREGRVVRNGGGSPQLADY